MERTAAAALAAHLRDAPEGAPQSFELEEWTVAQLQDAMRSGQQVRLEAIHASALSIVASASFRRGEQLKIRLRNDIQRITADLRGAVRRIGLRDDGAYLVEIDLFTRLMPLDVMALRRAGATDVELPDKIWV